MTEKDSGPEAGAKGAMEDVKGKVKEAAGRLVGNDALRREGQAQQDKADSQQEVAQKETAAEKARAEAAVNEARERAERKAR
jgi:uncharacterized protein YjbJ (UPF0337 family)